MNEIISILETTHIKCLPQYILNDLDYLCQCYLNEITEFDLSQVSDNMCNQEEIIQIDAKIHMLIFNTFRDKLLLLLQNEKHIDDILVHAYVEYYTELL